MVGDNAGTRFNRRIRSILKQMKEKVFVTLSVPIASMER